MSIYIPGCANPPAPICNDCFTKELGGIRGIWVQKTTYTFVNIEDPNEWEAAICAGNIYVFPYTNGTFDMAANTSEGYGNTPTTLDSYTCTLTFHEPNLVWNGSGLNGNVPFWNFIKNGASYLVGWKTQTQIWLSEVAAQFTPTTPIQTDIKTKIDIMVVATFVQEDMVTPLNATVIAPIWTACVDC